MKLSTKKFFQLLSFQTILPCRIQMTYIYVCVYTAGTDKKF